MWDDWTYLYYHVEDVANVLRAVTAIAQPVPGQSVDVVLPDDTTLTLPFRGRILSSRQYHNQDQATLTLKFPGRVDLWFELPCVYQPAAQPATLFPIPVHLIVTCGYRYAEFWFSDEGGYPYQNDAAGRELFQKLALDTGCLVGVICPDSDRNQDFFLDHPEQKAWYASWKLPEGRERSDYPDTRSAGIDPEAQGYLDARQQHRELHAGHGDSTAFYEKWIKPFHRFFDPYDPDNKRRRTFLDYLDESEQAELAGLVKSYVPELTDDILKLLLSLNDYHMVGLCFIALTRRHAFTEAVLEKLRPYWSWDVVYITLACLNNEAGADAVEGVLQKGLNPYLADTDGKSYASPPSLALPVLMHYDRTHGTQRSKRFVDVWERYVAETLENRRYVAKQFRAEQPGLYETHGPITVSTRDLDLDAAVQQMDTALDFLRKHFPAE